MSHWPGHRNYGKDIYKAVKGLSSSITQTSANAGPSLSSYVKTFGKNVQTAAGNIGKAVTGSDNLANVKANVPTLEDINKELGKHNLGTVDDVMSKFTKDLTGAVNKATSYAGTGLTQVQKKVAETGEAAKGHVSNIVKHGSSAGGAVSSAWTNTRKSGPNVGKMTNDAWTSARKTAQAGVNRYNALRNRADALRRRGPNVGKVVSNTMTPYQRYLDNIRKRSGVNVGRDLTNVGSKVNETLTAGIEKGTKAVTDVGSAVGTVASDVLTKPMEKVSETLTAVKEDALDPVGKQVTTGMQNLTTNIGHVSKELGVFLKDPTKQIRDQTSAWEKKLKGYGDEISDNVFGTVLGGLGKGIRDYLKKPGGKKAPGASAPGLGDTDSIGSVGSYAKSFGTEGLKVATLSGKKSRLKQNKRALRV